MGVLSKFYVVHVVVVGLTINRFGFPSGQPMNRLCLRNGPIQNTWTFFQIYNNSIPVYRGEEPSISKVISLKMQALMTNNARVAAVVALIDRLNNNPIQPPTTSLLPLFRWSSLKSGRMIDSVSKQSNIPG